MASIVRERVFDLRIWQKDAYNALAKKFKTGGKNFLCEATPGGGKTKFALRVVHEFLRSGVCNRVVVVAPTENLKEQWAREANDFAGLQLDPNFSNAMGREANDYHGAVLTYALVGMDKKFVQANNTANSKTFVILDEVHHCGDKEHLTWGNAIAKNFENAVFILSISGTAFRSDDAPIPFVDYDENQTSKADYRYSYEQAIKDNVCRPVFFSSYDGDMKWRVGEQEFEHSFKDSLTPDQVSKRLKTALAANGDWVKSVLKAADDRLNEIRKTHRDAGGLITAATQKHAADIAAVLGKITGVKPPVVISSEGDGNEIINSFRLSNEKWLVSVKMVSEGVDIPRLRVGVYLTNVKAELFFRQFVGRFVRVLQNLQSQDAFVFIPQDRELVKLAESIQEERDHALNEADKSSEPEESNKDLFGNEYTPALKGRFVPLDAQATSNKVISVNIEISNGMKTTTQKAAEADPLYQQKLHLKERINSLARAIAIKEHKRNNNQNAKPEFNLAHKIWIHEKGGKSIELETIDELRRRVHFFEYLINRGQL